MDSKILHILLVDDDPDLLATMGDIFELKGFAPILVGTGRAALAQFEQQNIDVALIDLKLEDMSGLEVLRGIKTNSPDTECILLTGYASQGSAIEAVNAGAYSYFQKPCDLDQLVLSVQRAAEKRASGQKVQRLLEQQLAINQLALALGESLNLNEVYHTIHQHLLSLVDMRSLIISSYDEQAKMIRAEYAQSDRVYDVSGLPALPLGVPGQGTQSQVIHTGQPLYTPDHQQALNQSNPRYIIEADGSMHEENASEKDQEDTARSAVYLPMKIKGKVVGILQVQSRRLEAYSEADIHLLAGIANVAAVAIQNARLHEEVLRELAERRQAEQALQESEERFRVIFEKANDGIHITNAGDRILAANPRMCEIVGYTREELLNMRVSDLQAPEVRQSEAVLQNELARYGNALFESQDLHRSGRRVPVEISVARIELSSGESYVSVVRDITERKQAEESSRRHLAELEVLYDTGLSINSLLETKQIARKMLENLSQKMAWHHAAVRLYDPGTQRAKVLALYHAGLSTQKMLAEIKRLNKIIPKPGEGLSGWVIQQGLPIRCGNVANDRRYTETFEGMQSCLYVPMLVGEHAIGAISVESEQPDAFSEADERLLVTLAAQASVAMDNARLFEDLQQSNLNLTLAYDDTIRGWSQAMELRDKETEGHAERVTQTTVQLAQLMSFPHAEIVHIRRGALLHDIGKMGVPDAILLKADKLTQEEWEIMQQHPVFAYEMLASIDYLRPALAIPHYHHERWDGSGYPDGLTGEQIPLQARLFAIVDVYDALISDRPYRPAWTKERALEHIRAHSGTHFDPEVVAAFLRLIPDLK